MKTTLGILIVAVVGILIWRVFLFRQTAPPVPKPPPLVARPTPLKRHLAPPGTYFLLERASITSNTGVIGFAPGTKVTLVKTNGSAATVTDGQYQFEIALEKLTNDLDIAKAIATSDHATQVKIANLIETWIQEHNEQQNAENREWNTEQTRIESNRRAAQRREANPLNYGAYNSTSAKKFTTKDGHTYWIDVMGRVHYDN